VLRLSARCVQSLDDGERVLFGFCSRVIFC
jgi:hypothetical protein